MRRIAHIGCSVMVLGMFAEPDKMQLRSRCCAAAGHWHSWIARAEASYSLITESTTNWVSVQRNTTPLWVSISPAGTASDRWACGFCQVWNVGGYTGMSEQALWFLVQSEKDEVINVEVIWGRSPVLICCDNAAGVRNILVFFRTLSKDAFRDVSFRPVVLNWWVAGLFW